jgi:hypothetical protein
MRHVAVKPESARASRRRMNRGKTKRLALMGAISATVAAVGLTPALANAASSQTYVVGFPDWLGIGAGAVLPSDPIAINNAIVAAKDDNPLIAWGLGPVDLKPVFVKWYTPVNPLDPTDQNQDQYYTPGEWGVTGSHQVTVNQDNPAYQPAYDSAYAAGYQVARAAYLAKASEDASTKAYNDRYAQVYQQKYTEYINKYCKIVCNPSKPSGAIKTAAESFAKGEAVIEAGKAAAAAAQNAANDPVVAAAADAAGKAGGLAAAIAAVEKIPQTIEFTTDVPDFGWKKDGYWTTTTSGQWVASPSDLAALPTVGQLAYLANAVQNGDLSALAPVLNWTAYLSNVNLIAYGDGAIAAGTAYQAYIDSAKGNTHDGYNPFVVGDPQTGPRTIRLTFGDGKVTVTHTDTTNNPLEIPLPNDVTYPDAPPVGWETVQDGGVVDLTLLSLVLVRNPGRANGGLYSRFAGLYEEMTGVDPVSPERQDVLPDGVDPDMITKLLTGNAGDITFDELGNLKTVLDSVDGKPIVVTLKADVGWEYDMMSDAPATANPVAWANSLASSVFLTNLLTGVDFSDLGSGGYVGPDGTVYYTLPVDQLPLFAGPRLVAAALGLVTGTDVDTPVADALEPLAKILVNIGYTDVVRNADGTYTRSLDKMGDHALFGTRTLTRAQMALLPGDLIAAAGVGVGGELSDALIRVKDQLVKVLNVKLTEEQNTALNQALSAPGTTLREVARSVGDGVSKVASTVEAALPEGPAAPTQEQLSAEQHKVGQTVAAIRDTVADVADTITPPAHESADSTGPSESEKRDTANKFTPSTPVGEADKPGTDTASDEAPQGDPSPSAGADSPAGSDSDSGDSGSDAA